MLTQQTKDEFFKTDIKNVCKHFASEQRKNLSKNQLEMLAHLIFKEMQSKCL